MTNNILRYWQSIKSDDPMQGLFSAAPILMHSIDERGILLKVSQFWADKLGYSVDDMVGRASTDFLSPASKEYAEKVVLPEFFRTGKIYNVEYDFVRKDGQTLPVLMSAMAEYNDGGAYVRSLAVMFDNTEAKHAAAELSQKQRMEAIGSLVGGVAHDFNNLLAIVQGNLEFLKRDPDDKDRGEFIDTALSAVRRGAGLTQQLLSYGRKAHLTPTRINLNEIVKGADRMVKRLMPANVLIETVTDAGLWETEADPALLETAILNILNNARDAMPDGGRITMETCNVRISGDYILSRQEELEPGRYVMLAISDTGAGIDAATLAQVFEPFFTTKTVGQGSGLGLSMVFGFMRQSKGTIRAYSEVGVGTTFKLYFPAANAANVPVYAPRMERQAVPAGETILVAEDDLEVRRVLVRQLSDENLTVVECASGDEALRQIEGGVRPTILLTDIVMPGSVQGPELAARVRDILPDIHVLFISGYPTEAAIHGNGVKPEDKYLVKPVNKSELISAVHDLLRKDD
ncbi:PAS domain-containing hybrid sensor histidine kinase/response regulator [uncultured Roseobacter sp.]|uniref:PAS domain-containing hybrid sensor histidine kinase/response regulator n=1 Tax=uncultured Roseobacter sp. TaxID=114847 RepID=UPI002629125D|nr:PAS domain-containing hybrid sensor histidine kinase/response regulator [uncultured Roseobacter sp.]